MDCFIKTVRISMIYSICHTLLEVRQLSCIKVSLKHHYEVMLE